MLLKRELGPKSWPLEAVVGVVSRRRGGASWGMGRGFNSAENELQFCVEKGLIFGTIGPRSGRDRAAIGPRSGRDRAEIGPRSGHDQATIAPRSGHNLSPGRSSVVFRSSGGDSAAETPRSRLDQATILEFFQIPSSPSD